MKKDHFKLFFLTILASFYFVQYTHAKYVQTCKVKYAASYGWSKYYTVDVTFMTGSELNKATSSLSYSSFSTYAIIFWGQNEATVIKLTNILGCGYETKQSCISNHVMNLNGSDQEVKSWEVCTKQYCY
jgi:hypothetical protein